MAVIDTRADAESDPLSALGRGLGAVTALLLALATLVPLPERDGATAPPPPPELEAALAEVESGEAEAEAEAVAGQDGLVAAGTPCTMRHRRVAPGVERAFRHRLAAATLATGPEVKDTLLAEIEASAPSGPAAWRVALIRAELALRDRRGSEASDHLDRAQAVEMPEICRADELFLRAAAAPRPADAVALLDAAVAADPGFWAAQERLAVLSAKGTGSDAVSCGRDAARVIGATVQLAALATRDAQFERLERALVGLEANGRTALLRGMILRQTGRTDDALRLWTAALPRLGAGECDATLRVALDRMLRTLDEETP
jgi:hypothetical protein